MMLEEDKKKWKSLLISFLFSCAHKLWNSLSSLLHIVIVSYTTLQLLIIQQLSNCCYHWIVNSMPTSAEKWADSTRLFALLSHLSPLLHSSHRIYVCSLIVNELDEYSSDTSKHDSSKIIKSCCDKFLQISLFHVEARASASSYRLENLPPSNVCFVCADILIQYLSFLVDNHNKHTHSPAVELLSRHQSRYSTDNGELLFFAR